jgi:DedD protein
MSQAGSPTREERQTMRDAHRMKEKFDVSLDNRQIVSLLIAGIVVMGAVFVLGVVVGKKLAGNAQAAAAPDLLSALDANAQALQEAQNEPPLTFQDELTRKAAAEPAAPEPKKAAAPKPAPTAAATPAPKPTPAAAAAPAVPAAKPPSAEKPAEQSAATEKAETAYNSADEELAALAAVKKPQAPVAAPAEKPAPAAVPAPAPKPAPGAVAEETVPTRTATPPGGALKEAIARATTQRPAEAVPGGAFTLQLSAFQTREEADRFAGRLRDRGYAPYIVAAEVANKGTWYRVRMGSFPSRDAATRYLSDFKRETQLDAFVAGTN